MILLLILLQRVVEVLWHSAFIEQLPSHTGQLGRSFSCFVQGKLRNKHCAISPFGKKENWMIYKQAIEPEQSLSSGGQS